MVVLKPSEVAAIYRETISYPSPSSAKVSFNEGNSTLTLESYWSQRDVDRKEKVTFLRTHTVDIDGNKVISQSGPQEIKNELWNKKSPSGKFQAIVRSGKDKKNEDKQFLEIYDKTRKIKTIDVLALEKHGKIIENDGQFGSFEWSSSEGHLLYLAERKKPKTGSFFDPKASKDSASGDDDDDIPGDRTDEILRGDEFVHVETWGEQLEERVHPVVCVMDVEAGTVSLLENLPGDISPGQAVWTPDDAGVVVAGWTHEPYRLGLKFCIQRRSFIYHLDIQKGSAEILSEEGRAVRFPRFSPDMNRLVYFDVPVGGGHVQCSRVVMIDWETRARKVVVDEVGSAPVSEFPGVFTPSVNKNIWLEDSVHLVLDTSWRSTMAIIVINTDTGSVTRINKDSEKGSMSLLCVEKDHVVLSCSSLNQPFHLLIGKVIDIKDLNSIEWFYPDGTPETLDWLSWSTLQHKPSKDRVHPKYSSLTYESLLCLPKPKEGAELPPLVLFSHGGPNSVFDNSFLLTPNFFCQCGYAVLMVNYRGSVGFGQESVLSLTGNIGTQDVRDIESALLQVVAKGCVDGNKIFACGGSHGGFLTTHLIGQYPDTFKAAASRNPVINLTSMYSTTDIPDWIFSQAGLSFDFKSLANDELLPKLWRASPMSYVDQVKTPMMLMIGLEDKRVPPAQGMEYWKALKARGVPVRYLTYPGNNHSIAEVEAEADCMVNIMTWFNKYL